MKNKLAINVRGKRKEWSFIFEGDPKFLEEWRSDGLVIDEVINTIPRWWVDLGFSVKLYCDIQDFFTGGEK